MGTPKSKKAAPVALTETDIRLIAARAGADVRTVRRWLANENVRGASLKERLAEARRRVEAERTGGAS